MPLPPPDPTTVVLPVPAGAEGGPILGVVVSAAIGILAGGISGLVWGGVGGRIAMRLVLLTSDDHVRGLTSDDGFEIGTVSVATIFLLILTTILGGFAGFVYGLIRMVTAGPTWALAAGTAIAAAALGGGALVHSDGIDFRVLEPLWLTVGLFVLIPGLWGVTIVVVSERLLRSDHLTRFAPVVHRRYWRPSGWVLLAALTAIGVRDLVGDIRTLT